MCGIAGFIGKSKKPEVSFQIMNSVFDQLEVRGTDASGMWGTQSGDGKIIYHKEPEKSSDFINTPTWKSVCAANPDLLIIHARASSTGVGTAHVNKNNHPFASTDRTIGLAHNGRIPDIEYKALKQKYEVNSSCDSEILLRIFEAGEILDDDLDGMNLDDNIIHRISGLRNIWSQVVKGQMAVAIGERLEKGHRRLWLFRNRHRPLWLMDLRKTLGLVFFCSTPEIWHRAILSCPEASEIVKTKTKLIELPTEEIWVLSTNPAHPILENKTLRKFDVRATGFTSFEHEGDEIKIPQNKPVAEVITKLDDDEDVIGKKSYCSTNYNSYNQHNNRKDGIYKNGKWAKNNTAAAKKKAEDKEWDEELNNVTIDDDDNEDNNALADKELIKKVETTIATIREKLDEIETVVKSGEDMTAEDGVMLADALEQSSLDMEGSLKLLGK